MGWRQNDKENPQSNTPMNQRELVAQRREQARVEREKELARIRHQYFVERQKARELVQAQIRRKRVLWFTAKRCLAYVILCILGLSS